MFRYNIYLKNGAKITTSQAEHNLIEYIRRGGNFEVGNDKKFYTFENVIVVSSDISAIEILEIKEGE